MMKWKLIYCCIAGMYLLLIGSGGTMRTRGKYKCPKCNRRQIGWRDTPEICRRCKKPMGLTEECMVKPCRNAAEIGKSCESCVEKLGGFLAPNPLEKRKNTEI